MREIDSRNESGVLFSLAGQCGVQHKNSSCLLLQIHKLVSFGLVSFLHFSNSWVHLYDTERKCQLLLQVIGLIKITGLKVVKDQLRFQLNLVDSRVSYWILVCTCSSTSHSSLLSNSLLFQAQHQMKKTIAICKLFHQPLHLQNVKSL